MWEGSVPQTVTNGQAWANFQQLSGGKALLSSVTGDLRSEYRGCALKRGLFLMLAFSSEGFASCYSYFFSRDCHGRQFQRALLETTFLFFFFLSLAPQGDRPVTHGLVEMKLFANRQPSPLVT